jgi:DNA (cytosine-5)-methyltransferase 1
MHRTIEFLRLGELFCGPGGLALGAMTAVSKNENKILRIKHVWANDIDESSCETYQYNITKDGHEGSVYCCDVHDLDIRRLSPIDIFAYGFPCNDFSIVGEQKGIDGDYGGLYKAGVKVLNMLKPKAFVAENVGGITSANDGETFKKILDDLSSAGNGYVLTIHLYKAEEYGVPQTRHRYFIVGFDKTLDLTFKVPAPTHIHQYVTAKETLDNIPDDALNHEFSRTSAKVIERLKYIKPGENVWTADLPEHLKLNVKAAKLSQIYKRLHPDKPSYTITGSGGGGTHGYHYEYPRPLTNRERARIQTFPDDYYFCGSSEQIRKQIGMAVPPLLSRVIFSAILDTFNRVTYRSAPPNYEFRTLPMQDKLF